MREKERRRARPSLTPSRREIEHMEHTGQQAAMTNIKGKRSITLFLVFYIFDVLSGFFFSSLFLPQKEVKVKPTISTTIIAISPSPDGLTGSV